MLPAPLSPFLPLSLSRSLPPFLPLPPLSSRTCHMVTGGANRAGRSNVETHEFAQNMAMRNTCSHGKARRKDCRNVADAMKFQSNGPHRAVLLLANARLRIHATRGKTDSKEGFLTR